jgi:glycosyltransferase involved in cell wall biosynthesis
MKISIIIAAYNEGHTISTQLDALKQQQWPQPWEVLVADNGSTDGTAAVVASYQQQMPHLRLLDASERPGAAHARNVAVAAAQGDYIVFCDADDEVAPDWLPAIATALEQHDFVASRFDHQKLNPTSGQHYGLTVQTKGIGTLWYLPAIHFASTSGMGIKKTIFEQVGGFDETMRGNEDTDFCIRVQKTGAALHFVPEAVVAYRHRSQNGAMLQQARRWARDNAMLYQRYRPKGSEMPHAWSDYFFDWLYVLPLLLQSVHPGARAQLAYKLGWQIGLLQGSLAYGVEPPVIPHTTPLRRIRQFIGAARRRMQQHPSQVG